MRHRSASCADQRRRPRQWVCRPLSASDASVIAVGLFLVYGIFVTVAIGVSDGPWWVLLVLLLFWMPFAKGIVRAILARRGQDLPASARQAGIQDSGGQMDRSDHTSSISGHSKERDGE